MVYSISKTKKYPNIPKSHEAFLSVKQFPSEFKGIPFQFQTPRKDITDGMPSPHEERFTVHNLIPSSCSKFTNIGTPNISKYAIRKDIFKKTEFSPDYKPNKEYVLAKIIHNIKFEYSPPRKIAEWPKIYDGAMASCRKPEEKRTTLSKIKEHDRKQGPRIFSPSKFL